MLNEGQDKRISIYHSYCVFSLLFSQNIIAKHDITSTEISCQFLALKVPVLRRNKATNFSTSNRSFSAATKTPVLDNLGPLHMSPVDRAEFCLGFI